MTYFFYVLFKLFRNYFSFHSRTEASMASGCLALSLLIPVFCILIVFDLGDNNGLVVGIMVLVTHGFFGRVYGSKEKIIMISRKYYKRSSIQKVFVFFLYSALNILVLYLGIVVLPNMINGHH